MRDLPPGWATDLAILEYSGATIDDRGDHLVVRSPRNPDFHWGNCLFVTDHASADDAGRWVATFRAAFPNANWISIGLARMPGDQEAWIAHGLELESIDVLTTRALPQQTPPPAGYTIRRFVEDDWERSVARAVADNLRSQAYDPVAHERFARAQADVQRELSASNTGARFGAFADGVMVAELGIICCGTSARYQSVSTELAHQGRGLASHLLGVAARWAADQGCNQWVIVTESTNPASRVYRRAGFEPDVGNVSAYRPPPLADAARR